MNSQENKVWWDEQVPAVQIYFYKKHSEEEANKMINTINELIEINGKSDKVNILLDTSDAGVSNGKVRQLWINWMKSERFTNYVNKFAGFGGPKYVRFIANLMIFTTGQKNIQFFKTKDESSKWFVN